MRARSTPLETPAGRAGALDRSIDGGASALAGGTIGYHAALVVDGGLAVFAAVGVLFAIALHRFIRLADDAAVLSPVPDEADGARLWTAAAAVAAATAVAVYPGPRKGVVTAAVVAAVLWFGFSRLASPTPTGVTRWRTLGVESLAVALAAVAGLDLAGAVSPPPPLSLPFTLVGAFAATGWAAFGPGPRTASRPPAWRAPTSPWRPTRDGYAILAGSGAALGVAVLFGPGGLILDDLYYIRKANTFAGQWTSFTEGDVLHGLEDGPHVPGIDLYQAFEAFVALVSSVTGVHPAALVGALVAPVVVGLAPFAAARLGAAMGARNPTMVGVVATAIMFTINKLIITNHFVLGQSTHGKGIFTLLLIPLLLAAAIDYLAAPGARRLRTLLVIGVASVGATSTASALAPIAIGVAVVGAWPAAGLGPWVGQGRRALNAAAASALAAYPVVVLVLAARADGSDDGAPARGFRETLLKGLIGSSNQLTVSANRAGFVVAFVLLFVALVWAGRTVGRRYLTALWGLVILVLLNPELLERLGDRFDAVRGSHRLAWLIPTAVVFAVACDALVRRPARVGPPLAAGCLAVALALGPASTLTNKSSFPDVDLRAGVSSDDWDAAGRLAELTEPGTVLVLPRDLARAVTLRLDDRHAYIVRFLYFTTFDDYEVYREERRLLRALVDGEAPADPPTVTDVADALDRVEVGAVCHGEDPPLALTAALDPAFSLHPDASGLPCTLWIRR